MAAAATAPAGRRAERTPRRVLARRGPEPVVRRQRRGLGARALLAGRRDSPRVAARRPPLQARITRYVDFIVGHQRPDGWYGPYPEDAVARRYDMWAILLANKVLAQYHDATGDARVLDAVVKSLRALLAGLDRTPLYGWGKFRWYEGAGAGLLRVRADARALAPGAREEAPRPGRRLPRAVRHRRPRGPDAAARPLEVDQARGEHRHGGEGVGDELAPRPTARRTRPSPRR